MKNWIKNAIKKPGSFTAEAKKRGMTPAQLQTKVLSNKSLFSKKMVKRAQLRKALVGMHR